MYAFFWGKIQIFPLKELRGTDGQQYAVERICEPEKGTDAPRWTGVSV